MTDTQKLERQEMQADLWEAVAQIHDVADGIAPTRRLEGATHLISTVMRRLEAEDAHA
jgi:hypothetical protein